MSSFVELGASAPVAQALAERGIHSPFEIQTLVIPDALAGRDVLARSRTGSGKTLAFAIPIVERLDARARGPLALVLVPTRELAVQVAEELAGAGQPRGVRVAAVYGGMPLEKQAAKARKAHVIVATPGRLDDVEERGLLSLARIDTLVLDEADRMLDMGFQPQVDRIVARIPRDRQTLFFSATLDQRVLNIASRYTRDAVRHEIVPADETRLQAADHRFVQVSDDLKLDKLIEILKTKRDLALVFVRTKRGADRLAFKLRNRGMPTLVLHGDMTQAARQKTFERFAAGRCDVLVATDVAARGIHLEDITHVINYDAPTDKDDYVHRTGRTARAGRGGTAVTFVSTMQQHDVGQIARQLDLRAEFESAGLRIPRPIKVYSSRRNVRGRRR